KGLRLATPKDSPKDIFDARALLTYALLKTQDYPAAAVLGDHIARTHPATAQAANVGLFGLQGYSMALSQFRNAKPADGADEEEQKRRQALVAHAAEADQRRMIDLARYIERTWPNEAAADAARFQLGGLLMRAEKNFPEAVKALARVSPGFKNFYKA